MSAISVDTPDVAQAGKDLPIGWQKNMSMQRRSAIIRPRSAIGYCRNWNRYLL